MKKAEGVRKLWDKYKFVGLTVLIGVGLLVVGLLCTRKH